MGTAEQRLELQSEIQVRKLIWLKSLEAEKL